jgi:hypothetical protein
MAFRRVLGALLALVTLVLQLWIFVGNTDFPTKNPRKIVDAKLIARLRGNPGLHLALDPGYTILVPLNLEDDSFNRSVYGTTVDLRERVAERAIHIQKKDGRLAIHADRRNPKASWWMWFLHGTLDVPLIPLALLFWLGIFLFVKKKNENTTI